MEFKGLIRGREWKFLVESMGWKSNLMGWGFWKERGDIRGDERYERYEVILMNDVKENTVLEILKYKKKLKKK